MSVDPLAPGAALELAAMSYAEVEARLAQPGRKIALIPAGSTEAHGPHLPLATDSIISEEMARRGAVALAARGYLAVRFPTMHYAVTDWAAAFKGSCTLSAPVAEGLVLETCLAAARMGFDRVVLTNAHLEPGNIASLRRVSAGFAEHSPTPLLFVDVTRRRFAQRLTEEFRSGSCHAGRYETSLVLAARPDWVRPEQAAALPSLFVPMHEKIRGGAQDFLECGMDRAYCGDPAAATAQEGHATFDLLADMVVEVVDESYADPTPPGETPDSVAR